MATEEEAHQARAEHSDYLRKSGAHAIAVDKYNQQGNESFGVVAYYQTEPQSELPTTLEIEREGKTKNIPLEIVIGSQGSLE